jgi:hypothetical protein
MILQSYGIKKTTVFFVLLMFLFPWDYTFLDFTFVLGGPLKSVIKVLLYTVLLLVGIIFPIDGVSTLLWWWGLSAPETLRAMPAVA